MRPVDVSIADLRFDLGSTAFGRATNQREALQRVIDDQQALLVERASEIVEASKALGPPLVVRDESTSHAFVVVQGARTVAALRILADPTVLDGLDIRPFLRERAQKLARRFHARKIGPVRCIELPSPEFARFAASTQAHKEPPVRSSGKERLGHPVLRHFSPLRYPGGKGRLAPFVKKVLQVNDLLDGHYVEPYAGGAGIGLELLIQDYVSRIYINDISRPVFALWNAVLHHTEELVRRVKETPRTVASWDRQKTILANSAHEDDVALGFATLFLNRTNRSGILNGGIIGGRDQTGAWKIDARYNPTELIARIGAIARFKHRIAISREDAKEFLRQVLPSLPERTLIYLDPPYYVKGKDLYYDFYAHDDHLAIAKLIRTRIRKQRWMISYDNVSAIRELYSDCPGIAYSLGYSAREVRAGSEVMFFDRRLIVPRVVSAMRPLVGGARPRLAACRPTKRMSHK